ncbi:unnamed protein product [Allacma fusca]|uniref:phosphoinositide phospholipase C n=1 Tax=Allacma fusca TaxID=39272 RepID=A0A8J2NY50_9HEXA|nr:unnamed protein product [Allacma fusca]
MSEHRVSTSGVTIPEMELLISQLERGTVVTKFNYRKRPEKKTLMIRRETRQIVWQKTSKGLVDGAVDFREVRDIRVGKSSKDFEKWPEDGKKHDNSKCFVVFYGSEFRLSTLSIAALSEKECELWVRTIKYLVMETKESSYSVQLETWLRKQFYNLEASHSAVKGSINLKELKAFLPKINCKLSTGKLRDLFQDFDAKKSGEIGFDDFAQLFHQLMHDPQVLNIHFQKYLRERYVDYDQVNLFLREEQNDSSTDINAEMNRFFQDPNRTGTTYITAEEFLDYLFSKQNTIWDEKQDQVCQDMTRPLSHYYIASSHNTYLTGDQFSSESSTEAYIRCLLNSCRCVELDCWDGSDGQPFIFHGHTLTSKIRFSDVCRVIRDYAFAQSEYPLILSIEDHCTLPQQRKMAQLFVDTFGDSLVVNQLNKTETALPSPEQLRGRIILKHKKLPEGVSDDEQFVRVEDFSKEMDLSNTIKNGTMYIEDNSRWQPHFFVLTKAKLLYTEMSQDNSINNEQANSSSQEEDASQESVKTEELHYSEKWFHGRLKGGRSTAVVLISNYKQVDGTFLVRESETFVGDYTLSAWRKGRVIHCHIHSKYEWGQVKYYLVDSMLFDSLYSLIMYYREHPIRGLEFHVKLGDPVPQPSSHEGKPWFHTIDRIGSEDLLKRVRLDGTYLVRPSSTTDDRRFVISFRAKNKIKHCVIKEDGRLFIVGQNKFETIVDLVTYYQKHAFYSGVCLKYPLTEDLLRAEMVYFENTMDQQVYTDYLDTNVFKQEAELSARALYDYKARREDELTFEKDDVIINIVKEHDGWWRGCVDLTGAVVELRCVSGTEFPWRVFIEHEGSVSTFGVERKDEGILWVEAIRSVGEIVSERETENKRMERVNRIAKELSSLIIYCCSVNKFSMERIKTNGRAFQEMSSFPETTADKLFSSERDFFMWYHQVQLSRVYPKGQRLDSSNYNPVPFWSVGCQMVALNYQTPDKALQINQGKFRQNGACGYILRPEFMFATENFYEPEPIEYIMTILAGRHLWKSGRGIISPFVEIELLGSDHKNQYFSQIFKTRTVQDNGLNPYWNECFRFSVLYPECAMLRIIVYDEDMFGDPNFVGQCTYQINCLKSGYRSIQLLNGYSEEIELASLLVHFKTVTN